MSDDMQIHKCPSCGMGLHFSAKSGKLVCDSCGNDFEIEAIDSMEADENANAGLVVGATYPEQGKILRQVMPKSFILVPGYGAQGGKGADLVHFFNKDGLGAIVNSSRGIIAAYKQDKYKAMGIPPENFADASRMAVIDMIDDIAGALGTK